MSVALPVLRSQPARVRRLVAIGFLVVWLVAVLPWLWVDVTGRGGVTVLVVTTVGVIGLVSTRWLMPAALVLVALSADALGAFGDHGGDSLPFLQVTGGIRVTIRDALLIAALPLAIARLVERREAPVFVRPFLLVTASICVAFLLGILSDGDVRAPLNTLRPLFGYALYVILVAAVDTRAKLRVLLGSIFGLAVVSVAIQLAEVARGAPFPFLAVPSLGGTQALVGVAVDGRQVPYIWNRAVWHIFLSLFLGLGCLLVGRASWVHAGVALACLAGFVAMLTRSWYVFIAVGGLVLLVAAPNWARRLRFAGQIGLGVILLGVAATAASQVTLRNYGGTLLDVGRARAATLLSFQQDPSYATRVAELGRQWHAVLARPVLGYGLSAEGQRLLQVGNLDTGAVNTLVLFGFLGTAPFVCLILCAAWVCMRLARHATDVRDRGYASGLLGLWAGVLVAYAFNYDLLTYRAGPWLVVLAMTLTDRLVRLPGSSRH